LTTTKTTINFYLADRVACDTESGTFEVRTTVVAARRTERKGVGQKAEVIDATRNERGVAICTEVGGRVRIKE
jgi:hypothetical protein